MLRLGEHLGANHDPALRRDFLRHEAAGPNLPVRMFVAMELSHDLELQIVMIVAPAG